MALEQHPVLLDFSLRGPTVRGPNNFHWLQDRLWYFHSALDRGLVHPDDLKNLRWKKFSEFAKASGLHRGQLVCDPPERAWAEFWADVERLGVWDLPAEFGDLSACDGLQVSTRLVFGDRSLVIVHSQCLGEPESIARTVRGLHECLQLLVSSAEPQEVDNAPEPIDPNRWKPRT